MNILAKEISHFLMPRKAATTAVLRQLFALSGNRCAFPNCLHPLINDKGIFIAQICHIEGVKGERYNPSQTDEQRRDANNLMLMCHRHHIETDDEAEYPVERLKAMKEAHEQQFHESPYQLPIEEADSILDLVNEKLETLFAVTVRVEAKVDTIQEKLDMLMNVVVNPVVPQEDLYIDQLEAIHGLRSQGKYKTALEMLLAYKNKYWSNLAIATKSKLLTNLAVTYFDLQQKQEAALVILEMEGLELLNENTCSLLCLAYSILNDKDRFEIYFDKTIKFNVLNVNAWIGKVMLEVNNPDFDIKTLPESIIDTPEIAYNLGELYMSQGQRDKAIFFFKKSLRLDGKASVQQADTKSVIASRLLNDLIDPFKYAHRHYTSAEYKDIEQIIQWFSEAWETLGHTELNFSRAYILLNRGVAYKLKREKDKALLDFQRAYELLPEILPFKNLFLQYIDLGKYDMAQTLLEEDEAKGGAVAKSGELSFLKSRLSHMRGDTEEAIRELEENITKQSGKDLLDSLTLIITYCIQKKLFEKANSYGERLVLEFPDRLQAQIIMTDLLQRQGFIVRALDTLDKALALVTDTTQPYEIFELASSSVSLGRFEDGARLFDRIADKNIANSLSQGLVHAHYRAGNIHAAVTTAMMLFEKAPDNPFLAEIILNILLESKRLDEALSFAANFLSRCPEKFHQAFLLKTAYIYHKKRDIEGLKDILAKITNAIELGMRQAFDVARLWLFCHEMQKAKEAAYKARNAFYDICAGHDRYIHTLLQIQERPEDIYPEMTLPGCVIILENENKQQFHYLISTDFIRGSIIIVHPEDRLAKRMLGKRVGDTINTSFDATSTENYSVSKIIDKYAYAFQESLRLLDSDFSGQSTLIKLGGKEDDTNTSLEQLINFLKENKRENQANEDQILSLYQQGMLPIGVMAGIRKCNIVEQWFYCRVHPQLVVYANGHNEQPVVYSAIEKNQPFILDVISLLTLFLVYSDQLVLEVKSTQLVVAQASLDELVGYLDNIRPYAETGRLFIGADEHGINRGKASPEEIQAEIYALNRLIKWIENCTQVRSPNTLLELHRYERVELTHTLTDSLLDTALLAKEMGGIVVSDDYAYKAFLLSEYNIQSFSTYHWNKYIFREDITRIGKITLELLLANYAYIPVTSKELRICYEKAGLKIDKPFTVALLGLLSLQPPFIAYAFVGFVKTLYLNPSLSVSREQVISSIIIFLKSTDKYPIILKMILATIKLDFLLMPSAENDFRRLISLH